MVRVLVLAIILATQSAIAAKAFKDCNAEADMNSGPFGLFSFVPICTLPAGRHSPLDRSTLILRPQPSV